LKQQDDKTRSLTKRLRRIAKKKKLLIGSNAQTIDHKPKKFKKSQKTRRHARKLKEQEKQQIQGISEKKQTGFRVQIRWMQSYLLLKLKTEDGKVTKKPEDQFHKVDFNC